MTPGNLTKEYRKLYKQRRLEWALDFEKYRDRSCGFCPFLMAVPDQQGYYHQTCVMLDVKRANYHICICMSTDVLKWLLENV